jgi:hypothetical protein
VLKFLRDSYRILEVVNLFLNEVPKEVKERRKEFGRFVNWSIMKLRVLTRRMDVEWLNWFTHPGFFMKSYQGLPSFGVAYPLSERGWMEL